MSGMSLNLGEEQMRAIVSEAIVAKLDEASRKALIQQAVEKMLAPDSSFSYGQKKQSPLEVAFETAVRHLTFEVAREYIASHPEVKERIHDALGLALEKQVEQNVGIRDAVASAVASALEDRMANR